MVGLKNLGRVPLALVSVLGFFVLFNLVACVRPVTPKESAIAISIPSTKLRAQSLPTTDLKYLLINVTGEGIAQPVVFEWNVCDACLTKSIPASFEVNVPMGPKRLFQVLAFYQSQTTGESELYYGDVPDKNLELTYESLLVPIYLKSTALVKQGMVMGRYLGTTETDTPTGPFRALFDPGDKKPPMEVFKSPMISGWFQIRMFEGLPLNYILPNGVPFLKSDGKLVLTDSKFDPSYKVIKAQIPTYWKGPTAGSRQERKGSQIVLGYFGASSSVYVSGTSVQKYNTCYDQASGIFSELFTTSGGTTKVVFDWTNTLNASNLTFQGGILCSDSALTGTNVFERYLKFSPERIQFHDSFFIGGFLKMFQAVVGGDAKEHPIDFNGNTITVRPLPEVPATHLDVYKLVSTSHMEMGERDICPAIKSGLASGWTFAGSGAFSGSSTSINIVLNTVPAEKPDLHLALCPRSADGALQAGGMAIPFWKFGGFGGSNKYSRFEDLPKFLTQGYCHPFVLKSYYFDGTQTTLTPVDMDYVLDLSPTAGMGATIYPSNNCTGSPITAVSILSGQSLSATYSIRINSGTGPFDFGATKNTSSSTSQFTVGTDVGFAQQKFEVNPPFFAFGGPTNGGSPISLLPNECYRFGVLARQANGQAYVFPSGVTAIASVNLGSVFTDAYPNTDCSSVGTTSFSILANQSATVFSLLTSNTATTNGVVTINNPSGHYFTASTFNYTLDTSAVSTMTAKLHLEGLSSPLTVGSCNPLTASLRNEQGVLVTAKSPLIFDLSGFGDLLFFEGPLCDSAPLQSLGFEPQQSLRPLYAMTRIIGTLPAPLGGTLGAAGIAMTPPMPFTSGPPITGPYLSMTLPKWSAPIIGSHEFGASQSIAFISNATQIDCYDIDGNAACPIGTITYTAPSGGGTSSGTFAWSLSAAQTRHKFRLSLKLDGYDQKTIEFRPFEQLPKDYRILTCDKTITGNVDISAIQTEINNNTYTTVCLASGLSLTNTSGTSINLNGKNLIGHSQSTPLVMIPFKSGQTGSLIRFENSIAEETLANFKFTISDSQTAIEGTSTILDTGAKWISNVEIYDTASTSASRGIELTNMMGPVRILNYKFTLSGTNLTSYGIAINGTGDTTTYTSTSPNVTEALTRDVQIRKSEMILGNSSTSPALRIEGTSANSSNVSMENSKITATNIYASNQPAIHLVQLYSGKAVNFNFMNSEIDVYSSSGRGIEFNSDQTTTGTLKINNSFIKAVRPIYLWYYTSANSSGLVESTNSIYHVFGDTSVVTYNVPNTTTQQNLKFTANHFVKVAGSNSSSSYLAMLIYGQAIDISHQQGGGATGGNRFCSTIGFSFASTLNNTTTGNRTGTLTTIVDNSTNKTLIGRRCPYFP